MLYILFENFRNYLDKPLMEAVIKKDAKSDNTISSMTLKKIFKYFHLSSERLNGNKPFRFTPRTPAIPYSDAEGNVIEDDFTNRVSLAPSVEKALEALQLSSHQKTILYVYAVDFVEISDDDIPTISLKAHIKKCPRTNASPYGGNFNIRDWLEEQPPSLARSFDYNFIAPSLLPPKWRNQFYGCVPDAKETQELWSVQPVKMYYLGQLSTGNKVSLSKDGIKIISRYLEKLSTSDVKEE